jgi:uncharacterized membrane protein
MTIDNHRRSIIKAISYRVIGVLGTMLIAYIFTGQVIISVGIAIVDLLVGMVFYYAHERIWNMINWGKK